MTVSELSHTSTKLTTYLDTDLILHITLQPIKSKTNSINTNNI